jgi:ADP-ribose pyrophosphatase
MLSHCPIEIGDPASTRGFSMTSLPRVLVRDRKRVFDGFFKVDELTLSHLKFDGQMSRDKQVLVFERGDAVAVLLFNRDTLQVVLVNQFKAPTLDKSPSGGWITEVAAGMIRPGETPEAAAIRETMEETGYRIARPQLIATFFSSPGGSSERIFLYFAEVGNADKVGTGGGKPAEGEDIEVQSLYPADLFGRLFSGTIDDPKLIIGAYWLREYLRGAFPSKQGPLPSKEGPLPTTTTKFRLKSKHDLIVGYKTGPILKIKDVDVWVNSENIDMTMDRFIGRTISANIRYGGAEKDDGGSVIEDRIADALRDKLGRRGHVKIGTVIETEAGALSADNNVRRILHIATVKSVAGPGGGVVADQADLPRCVDRVLTYAHKRNQKLFRRRDRHILIPMLGTGDGGLSVERVAPELISAAVDFLRLNPDTSLKEVYFLAFSARHKEACDMALWDNGELEPAVPRNQHPR